MISKSEYKCYPGQSGPRRSLKAKNLPLRMLRCVIFFQKAENSNMSNRNPIQLSGFLLCHSQPDSCVTAAATDLVTTDWGKAAPFSSSHRYISSQLQLAVVAEAATFLPDFRSGDLCVCPLLSLASETKLSLASLEREVQWLAAQEWKDPNTQIWPSYLDHSR